MKKRLSRKFKVLSLVLMLVMLINITAVPITALATEIPRALKLASTSSTLSNAPPSVGDITIPKYSKNPNNVEVNINPYPVYRTDIYNQLKDYGVFNQYGQYYQRTLDRSQYYTGSVLVCEDYKLISGSIESSLPYNEERNTMLHPELTLSDDGYMSTTTNGDNEYGMLSDYAAQYLDYDQTQLMVSGNLLSGYGMIEILRSYVDGSAPLLSRHRTERRLDAGETMEITASAPLSNADAVTIYARGEVMTDIYGVLIDDSQPYVKDIRISQEIHSDGNADLVMDVEFNEGIRFISEKLLNQYKDSIWVEVKLKNLKSGHYLSVKLYIDDVDGGKVVRFRGDIGLYYYNNYRVVSICNASLPTLSGKTYRESQFGYLDLVDGMVLPNGSVMNYDNKPQATSVTWLSGITAPLTDHAGNAVNLKSIINWSFGNQTFISNTFEAKNIEIYTPNTLAVKNGTRDPKLATQSDMYIGPTNPLTVYVYLGQELSDNEWSKVQIKLNVLDKDGNNLVLSPTSANKYTLDEVYDDGILKGTLLKYEDVKLSTGMLIDVPEGEEPRVRVIELSDQIDGKTVYPYVNESLIATTIYADFSSPEVTTRKYGDTEHEVSADNPTKYYTSSFEINIEDFGSTQKAEDGAPQRMAGILGSEAFVYFGGGVDTDTKLRYVISQSATPPESTDGYTDEKTLAKNGMVLLGSYDLLNDPSKMYVHVLFESGSLYVDDLSVTVEVCDTVGNYVASGDPTVYDYLIDEIPPVATVISKKTTVENENTTIRITLDVSATDRNKVLEMLYYFDDSGADRPAADAKWLPVEIDEFSTTVTATVERSFGGLTEDENRIYEEILWIKAVDEFGNESEPIRNDISLSLVKPSTSATLLTDPNEVTREHRILVTGPDASVFDGSDAVTRVTLTPLETDDGYAYVTLVRTGDTNVDVLALEGLIWYKVKIEDGVYTEVTEVVNSIGLIEATETHPLYEIATYYGELKISFENGYTDMSNGTMMIPTVGAALSDSAMAGSYAVDENYYTVRYASRYDTKRIVHSVDFGNMINREDVVVVEDADLGGDPYLFKQNEKGVNPMRNLQIHYNVSNISNAAYGLLDFDYESSYVEFIRVGENGEADTVVATQMGLAATASQYFTVHNFTDDGENYVSGAYYLRVTAVDLGGGTASYESLRVVLDAETADLAGLWSYSYYVNTDVTAINQGGYVWKSFNAEDTAFGNIGVVAAVGGETMRSSVFAVYSYGVKGLKITLSKGEETKTYEGITVGEIEGFKLWNTLSAPTPDEIELSPFRKDWNGNTLTSENDITSIYTAENIPKSYDGLDNLCLVKGVNTICYQVKMTNGYVSPIRQFTIVVTDEVPELNIAIEGYQPSAVHSQVDGVINADHVRFYIETAYSLNGSGNVNVALWSDYGMNLGLFDENGELKDTYLDDPSPSANGELAVIRDGLKVEEYADFAENSYTSNFPGDFSEYSALCTAVFVATDEYGGVTLVAPQLGDNVRYGNKNSWETPYEYVLNIDYYGSYYDDPYIVDDGITSWRVVYNQPVYFGKEVLGFETYLHKNTSDGEVIYGEKTVQDNYLMYNLFNICINDVELYDGKVSGYPYMSLVSFDSRYDIQLEEYVGNIELINLADAKVTLSGGPVGDTPVTVSFLDGDLITVGEDGSSVVNDGMGNSVGYVCGWLSNNSLIFEVAYPEATADKPAGTKEEITYLFEYSNDFGDSYFKTGTVNLTYITYDVSVDSVNSVGAQLDFSFMAKDTVGAGISRTGKYNAGTYTVEISDYYGGTKQYFYEITEPYDRFVNVTYDNFKKTSKPVEITLESITVSDGSGKNHKVNEIYVDVTDYAIMNVENSATDSVKIKVFENTTFSYRYSDPITGAEVVKYITVDNIHQPSPRIVWNYNTSEYNVADDGTMYRYGTVTVYLIDANFKLTDRYTQSMPSFTFIPGGENYYVFKAEDISATIGNETVELTKDIKVTLNLTLYEVPTLATDVEDDDESPSVQIRAYSNLNGAYSENKLAMKLLSKRDNTLLPNHNGYNTYEYIGSRANMYDVISQMGWSTAYRFAIETADSSRVRLFVKEGLYTEAPDYETGMSDAIDGVILNSKLLTVNENVKFTLFIVDEANNSSQVAFEVTEIGAAPKPSVTKVVQDNGSIKVYVVPPEGATEFDILYPTNAVIENDENGALKQYVIDFKANDDYEIIYSLIYEGASITSSVDVSVTEISLDEISVRSGGIVWSANKASEATAENVTVSIRFTDLPETVTAGTTFNPDAVSFEVLGDTLTVTYTDNNPVLELYVAASNGSRVTVRLDAVTNIDRTAPIIEVVSRELAANGRSLTLTLSTNERTVFKEGGYVGEKITGEDGITKYYYTRLITANGTFSYTFTDTSGIQSSITVEISELVLDELAASYSLTADGQDPVDDPSQLDVMTGDTVFVNPLRSVTAELPSGTTERLEAGKWNAIVIPDIVGGVAPYIVMTDDYGNILTHQFSKIKVPDTTPPDIALSKVTYSVREGTDRAEVEDELLKNMAVFDNEPDAISVSVEFTEELNVIGLTDVAYKATDAAGNTSVMYGKLRITSIYEPTVTYDGVKIFRDEGVIIDAGSQIVLDINCLGVDYKVLLSSGIRTMAQMKDADIVSGYSDAEAVSLGELEAGIYTICIVTEQRDYFRILISVK